MYFVINNGSTLLEKVDKDVLHSYPGFSLIHTKKKITLSAADGYQITGEQVFVNGQAITIPAGQFEPSSTPRSLLRFAGPIAQDWLARLKQLAIKTHFFCPPYGLCVEIPAEISIQQLKTELPYLAGMLPYQEQQCSRLLGQRHTQQQPHNWLDLICFSEKHRQQVSSDLVAQGYQPLQKSRFKLRLAYDGDASKLRKIAGIKIADFSRPIELAWTPLQTTLGADDFDMADSFAPHNGDGQIIAVADTGLDKGENSDQLHVDFQGRVKSIQSWPVNPSWSDYAETASSDDGAADKNSGHGTHVAGLALGDGKRSHGKYSGLAPKANLVFQAIEQYTHIKADKRHLIQSGYFLNGRPLDLYELFDRARQEGARIHVNAWGDPAKGQYTDDSYEADRFLWKNPDAVILFATGNAGSDSNGDRILDKSSLYAPASGKNVIAVGATEGPLAGVGYRGSWDGFDPQHSRFSNHKEKTDPVSGQPQHIAMISSTGPTRDGRIKPDVCAPGTNLPAARSRASASHGWGLTSPMPHYMYLGGTSMATGVAGGFMALLRQAWQNHLGTAPSGPALKALMIFGCQAVIKKDLPETEERHVAGFGRLYLKQSLPSQTTWLTDQQHDGLQTGALKSFSFTTSAAAPFRALLCWYDYPGEYLINDLDLCLITADGQRIWGNHEQGQAGQPDRVNSVERIQLDNLAAGSHTLQVIGANVPSGPQAYALVSSHHLNNEAAPIKPGSTLKLPVAWIKGIGDTFQRRLATTNINHISELVSLDQDKLADILQCSTYQLKKIQARLEQLQACLSVSISLPIDISLAVLIADQCPTTFDVDIWRNQRQQLISLKTVFDKGVLSRIQLSDLFPPR